MEKVIYIGSFSPDEVEKEELTAAVLDDITGKFVKLAKMKSTEQVYFSFGRSRGGDLTPAIDLVELFKKYRMPTLAFVFGKVSSASAILATGCRYGIAHPDASFVFHSLRFSLDDFPFARLSQDGRLPWDMRRELGKGNRRLAAMLKKHTRIPKREISIIMKSLNFFDISAQHALQWGVIDEIMPRVKLLGRSALAIKT